MHPFTLTNSQTRKKEPFVPMEEGKVRLYVCGPTVYDDAHLGHARSALSFDLLKRTLTALGYRVTYVRNVTDVDDKILKKMAEENRELSELTGFFTQRYHADMAALGVLPPDGEPKATEHIPQMAEIVALLLEKGAAYKLENGDVYFDTAKDPAYGSVSGEVQEETRNRVEAGQKKNSRDFVLWKGAKEGEVRFESPFGPGRPGWHLECSAMVQAHLAGEGEYAVDIHGGGSDLFFPHHENEGAQTRCAYGKELAKYWMHNGFVRIDGEKMSKSLGNSFFIKDALKIYPGEALRFYLLSTHYRTDFNFNEEDLHAARKRLDRLYRLKKRLYGGAEGAPDPAFKTKVLDALAEDLNVSVALAAVDAMMAEANEKLDATPKDKGLKKQTLGNIALLAEVMGFGGGDPYAWFQFGISDEEKENIEALIVQRNEARKAKDYAAADQARDALAALGVEVMDTPAGTVWEKK